MTTKTTSLSKWIMRHCIFLSLFFFQYLNANTLPVLAFANADLSMADVCYPPLGVSVGSINANAAVLSWTAPSVTPQEGYRIYISTVNMYPANNTPVATTTATTFLLDGLQPDTQYFYFVSSKCSNVDFSLWRSGNFRTLMGTPVITEGCLTYDLEYPSDPFTPACINNQETITTATETREFCRVNVLASRQYTFSSSTTTDFITISNASGDQILASGTGTVIWRTGTFSGTVRYYIHKNADCGDDDLYRTRYIRCSPVNPPLNTCNAIAITNLAASQVTAGSAYFTYDYSDTPSGNFQLYIAVSNATPTPSTDPTHDFGNATNYTVTGLQHGTTYHYWLRANCGGYQGNWVSGGSFTTLPPPNCSVTPMGQQPNSIITPQCVGSSFILTNYSFTGYYTTIVVQPNTTYTFTSQSNRYISLRNSLGTIYYKQGHAPLTWNSGPVSGTIQMLVHANASCATTSSVSASILLTCSSTLATDEFAWDQEISVVPNPASDKCNILTGGIIADHIYISDSLGRKVADFKPTTADTEVDVSYYSEGMYFVKLTKGSESTVKKIIVKH